VVAERSSPKLIGGGEVVDGVWPSHHPSLELLVQTGKKNNLMFLLGV
jgi:hypothetical protein